MEGVQPRESTTGLGREPARTRGLAIALGSLLGALLVLYCYAKLRPDSPARHSTITGARVERVEAPPTCNRPGSVLRVTSSAPGDWSEPRVRVDASSEGSSANAEWGGWAERRCLTLVLDEKGASARASVEYDTDYGLFIGHLDPERSSLHSHGDVLCFELAVERLDGSGFHERWRGELPLR